MHHPRLVPPAALLLDELAARGTASEGLEPLTCGVLPEWARTAVTAARKQEGSETDWPPSGTHQAAESSDLPCTR